MVEPKPFCFYGVVSYVNVVFAFLEQGVKSNANNPFVGYSVYIAENSELL